MPRPHLVVRFRAAVLVIAVVVSTMLRAQTVMNWSGGDMSAIGTTTIGASDKLNITGTSDHDFNSRTLTNNGIVDWGQGRLRSGNGGGIVNNAQWNDASGASYQNDFGGSYVFSNAAGATYTKTGANTTTFSNVAFNNAGMLDLQAGQVALNGGGSFSGNGSAAVAGGASLAFTNDYTISDASKLSGTGDYLLNSGTLTLVGTLSASGLKLQGGSLAGSQSFASTTSWTTTSLSTSGTTTVANTGTLTISGTNDHDFNTRLLVNDGTVNWTEGRLRSGNSGGITNNGQWNDSAGSSYQNDFGGSYVFTNAAGATYTKSGSGTTVFSNVPLDNAGAVTVNAGTLQLSAGGTSSGTFNVANTASVLFTNDYNVSDGSKLLGAGVYKVTGGTFAVTGSVQVANFQLAGGRLAGTHSFSGTVSWNGGTMSSTGTTTVAAGGTLAIAPAAGGEFDHDFNARVLVNDGTVNWQAGAGRLRSGNSGGITNNAQWNDAAGSSFQNDFGGGFGFTNSATGTYAKSGSGTTTFSNVAFQNAGTLDLQAGQVTLNGGGAFSGAGRAVVASGTTLYFSNDYTIPDASKLSGSGDIVLGAGTLSLAGTLSASGFKLQGGALAGSQTFASTVPWTSTSLNTSGTTTIAGTGTLTISGTNDHDFNTRALVNSGTVNWTQGRLRSGNSGSITNNGQWNDSAGSSYRNDFGGSYTFTNASGATYTKTGSGTTLFDNVPFSNSGNVTISAGTLQLHGGGTNSATGTFSVASDATLLFSNDYAIASGASLSGAGAIRVIGGTFTVDGSVTFGGLQLSGGTLAGTQSLNGGMTWNGGSLNSSGTTTVGAGAKLTVAPTATGGFDHDFNTRVLINNGTVDWQAGAGRLRSGNGGSITNNAEWNDAAGSSYQNDFGGSFVFTNTSTGVYTKSGAGTSVFSNVPFNNDGSVKVDAGTLQLNGGGTNSGTGRFTAATGTTVRFTNDYTVADGSSLLGAGTYQVTGGTFNAAGNIGVSNFQFSGGTLAGTHTLAGGVAWNGGNWNSAGTTSVGGTGTVTISGDFDHDFSARAIANGGTINWAAGRLRSGNGGTITNHGVFVDTADSSINSDYGGTSLTFTNSNSGVYRKTTAGTTHFFVPLINSGNLDLQAGVLALHSDSTLLGGTSVTGSGLLQLMSGTLTATGAMAFSNFEIAGGTVTGVHTFNGSATWTGGSFNSSGSTTTIGGTFSIGGAIDHDFSAHAFVNNGTVQWAAGAGRLRSGQGGTFTNNATFNDAASNQWNNDYGGTTAKFVNAGAANYNKNAAGTTTFGIPVENAGNFNVKAGTLAFDAGGTAAAGSKFDVFSGAALRFTGGSFSVTDGASFTGAGSVHVAGGTLSLGGNVGFNDFNVSAGTIAGSHTFLGNVAWTAGNFNAAGTTTIGLSGVFAVSSGADHDFSGHGFVNNGTVNWSGGRLRGGQGATVVNNGTFNDSAASSINSDYGGTTLTFTNSTGAFYNKSGANTTTVLVPFHTSGTVDVAADSVLALHAGGTIGANAAFTGLGQVRLTGGTFSASGTITSSSLMLTGATFAGTHTLGGAIAWDSGNFNAAGSTMIATGGTLTVGTAADHDFSGHGFVNDGTILWTGGRLRGGQGATLTNNNSFIDTASSSINSDYGGTTLTFTNASGAVYHKNGAGTTSVLVPFTNNGLLSVGAGTMVFSSSFGGTGGLFLTSGAVAQFGTPVTFNPGSLSGTGTINSSSVTAGGVVAPGNSAGTLAITGNLTLLSTSSLLIELGGTTQGTGYDFLSVGGTANLGGNLHVSFLNGFQGSVSPMSTFTILTGTTGLSGIFANAASGSRLLTSDGLGSFLVNYGASSTFGMNSVVLSNFVPVPEPSTWAMLGIGAVVLIVHLRRRR